MIEDRVSKFELRGTVNLHLHGTVYGSACGIPSHDEQKEVEANLDSDSDNENLDLSWGFFLKAPVA